MIVTLSFQELFWTIVVVAHVGHSSSKVNLSAMLASLDRVSLNVRRIGDDVSWILFTSEVLLDVCVVRFMIIGCTVVSLLDSALRLEPFFVTSSDLDFPILDPIDLLDSGLE